MARRYRTNDGFDPIPWIIGGVLAFAAYELYKQITASSSSQAPAAGGTAYTVPGQGGGVNF